MIDHRAGEGLTEAEALAAGYDPAMVGRGKLFESATLLCAHCQRGVVLNPSRTRERGYCRKCDAYICDECTAALSVGECKPFAKLADDVQNATEKGLDPWHNASSLLLR